MPTSPTPNMGLILPTLSGDLGEWDDLLNEALGERVDEHDHSSGKGVKVTPAGLNIDRPLSFAGHAALNLGAAQLAPVPASSMAGVNRALWVSDADNELYYRNHAGTDVQITTGGTLNVSIVGGIGGDYSTVGALLSFDDATHRYLAQQQGSPRPWAGIALGNLDLYEQAAGIVHRVRLQSPSALAASYALTLPSALPASTQLLQVSSAGALTASNSIDQPLSLASTLDVAGAATLSSLDVSGALNVAGAVTLQNTVDATGLITASAGVTLGADQHLTLSGTGEVKHGTRTRVIDLMPTATTAGSVSWGLAPGGGSGALTTAVTTFYVALREFNVGDRISAIGFVLANDDFVTNTYELLEFDTAGNINVVAATSNALTGFSLTCNTTLAPSRLYMIRITTGGSPCAFFHAQVHWSRP